MSKMKTSKRKPIDINFDYSKVKGSTELHEKFKREFMVTVSKTYPDVIVIPYDVAFVRAYSEPEICFQVNQKGVLDTIILGNGWYLFVDMKTGKNKLQNNQQNFKATVDCINEKEVAFKINSIQQGLDLIEKIR